MDCLSKYLKQPFELGKVGVMIDTSQMEPGIDLLKHNKARTKTLVPFSFSGGSPTVPHGSQP